MRSVSWANCAVTSPFTCAGTFLVLFVAHWCWHVVHPVDQAWMVTYWSHFIPGCHWPGSLWEIRRCLHFILFVDVFPWKQTDRQAGRQIFHWFTPHPLAIAKAESSHSQEVRPPHGWQGLSYLIHHVLLPGTGTLPWEMQNKADFLPVLKTSFGRVQLRPKQGNS